MVQVRQRLGVSERKACRVLGQARSTQRRIPKRREDEEALRQDVAKVARQVRTLRVPDGDGDAENGGLGSEPQAGGADLEAGGA